MMFLNVLLMLSDAPLTLLNSPPTLFEDALIFYDTSLNTLRNSVNA